MLDHCGAFALSDPKDSAYQARCDHEHNEVCDRCNLLTETLLDIEAGLAAQTENLSSEEREELLFRVKQGKAAIWSWKSHLLRSVNQDSARVEMLEKLDESSVLLVQDWAMKYLPRKYRESQTDWFGKCGIPWHVTVATSREGEEIKMLTFVHIFQACSQDSGAVLAAQDHNPSVKVRLLSPRQRRLLPLRSNHSQCQSHWRAIWCHHKAS